MKIIKTIPENNGITEKQECSIVFDNSLDINSVTQSMLRLTNQSNQPIEIQYQFTKTTMPNDTIIVRPVGIIQQDRYSLLLQRQDIVLNKTIKDINGVPLESGTKITFNLINPSSNYVVELPDEATDLEIVDKSGSVIYSGVWQVRFNKPITEQFNVNLIEESQNGQNILDITFDPAAGYTTAEYELSMTSNVFTLKLLNPKRNQLYTLELNDVKAGLITKDFQFAFLTPLDPFINLKNIKMLLGDMQELLEDYTIYAQVLDQFATLGISFGASIDQQTRRSVEKYQYLSILVNLLNNKIINAGDSIKAQDYQYSRGNVVQAQVDQIRKQQDELVKTNSVIKPDFAQKSSNFSNQQSSALAQVKQLETLIYETFEGGIYA